MAEASSLWCMLGLAVGVAGALRVPLENRERRVSSHFIPTPGEGDPGGGLDRNRNATVHQDGGSL